MRHVIKWIAVVSLVVADAVLLGMVARATATHDSGIPTISAPTESEPAILEPTGRAALTIGTGNVLIRTRMGSCAATGRPFIELSRDLGATFREIALPVNDGEVVSVVLSIKADSADELTVIGTGSDCSPLAFTTKDGGIEWKLVDRPGNSWWVAPDGHTIVTPEGESEPGCEVLSLQAFSEINAKVLCASGRISGTNDAGTTWVVLGELSDARAATFSGLRGGFAVRETPDCVNQAYLTGNAGGTWTPVGCIGGKSPVTMLVSRSSSRLIASDGEAIWISTDEGAKWAAPQPVK